MKKETMSVERLKSLGLEKASNDLQEEQDFNAKCAVAYERFRYVSPEKVDAFNQKLRGKTEKKEQYSTTYDKLVFTNIKSYGQVPPTDVLKKLEEAQGVGCFDEFEIAKIESVQERVDPILFGCIKNCPDKFYVAQWDTDVKIEDILAEDEG